MGKARRRITLKGIDASPGICVGLAHIVDRRKIQIPKKHIAPELVDEEIDRFQKALAISVDQLEALKQRLVKRRGGQEPKAIIDAHLLMMRDEALILGTKQILQDEGINAEWALQKTVMNIRKVFDALEDDYFRERRSDVEFVGQRVMQNLVGQDTFIEMPNHERAIIVANDLSPADTAAVNRRQVAGFVTERGGKTSHTAIIARSMSMPAVVGVEGAMNRIGQADRIIVDGYRGEVVLNPSDRLIAEALARSQGLRDRTAELEGERGKPASTRDGFRIMLSANVEMVEEVDSALRYGAEGVGLFRTEFLFMGRRPPTEGFQRRCYRDILRKMNGRPVSIRTLDIGGDKRLPFLKSEPETNPALGLRSIRLTLRQRKLFLQQLRALLRASADGQLKVMFPMISGLGELRDAKEALEEAQYQLKTKGQACSQDVKIGIMIEVPSAAVMSDVLAREVDFFSIGTNDLIQYTLAVDRHNDQVAYLFDPLHVSILRMLKMVIENAHAVGIPVCMCGEMAADPLYLHVLLGLELDEASMNPPALVYARHMIRNTKFKDVRKLVKDVFDMNSSRDIRHLVQSWMFQRFPDFFTEDGHADILGGL